MDTASPSGRPRRSLIRPAMSALLLLLLASPLLLAACGDDTATTPAITAPGATSTGLVLSDGEHFGFLVDVTVDHLLFDPAEFLTGDEALAAARADGYIGPDETLDNDFYIKNPEDEAASLVVDPAVTFSLLIVDATGSPTEKTIPYAALVSLWEGTGDGDVYYSGLAQGLGAITVPMNVDVTGGRVTHGSEQYLP